MHKPAHYFKELLKGGDVEHIVKMLLSIESNYFTLNDFGISATNLRSFFGESLHQLYFFQRKYPEHNNINNLLQRIVHEYERDIVLPALEKNYDASFAFHFETVDFFSFVDLEKKYFHAHLTYLKIDVPPEITHLEELHLSLKVSLKCNNTLPLLQFLSQHHTQHSQIFNHVHILDKFTVSAQDLVDMSEEVYSENPPLYSENMKLYSLYKRHIEFIYIDMATDMYHHFLQDPEQHAVFAKDIFPFLQMNGFLPPYYHRLVCSDFTANHIAHIQQYKDVDDYNRFVEEMFAVKARSMFSQPGDVIKDHAHLNEMLGNGINYNILFENASNLEPSLLQHLQKQKKSALLSSEQATLDCLIKKLHYNTLNKELPVQGKSRRSKL